jgi:hypothetical protein
MSKRLIVSLRASPRHLLPRLRYPRAAALPDPDGPHSVAR